MRITVPSMTGSVSWWSIQADRCLSQGCRPSHACAWNFPYRSVSVSVWACGASQVDGSVRRNAGPVPLGPPDTRRGWCGPVEDPVRAEPADHDHRQVTELIRQARDVAAGVDHDRDRRIAAAVLPGPHESLDSAAHLDGRDLGGVIIGSEPLRVEDLCP
jgi:hypothetical protein